MTRLSLLPRMVDCKQPDDSLVMIEQRCLRKRLNTNECQLCLEACPHQALTLEGRTVHLATERCTGCLRCRAVCPNDVFVSDFALEQAIGSRCSGDDTTVFSCTRQPQHEEREIRLPCFGIISPAVLVSIGASGSRAIIFRTGPCAACVNVKATEAFLAIRQTFAGLIERLFAAMIIISDDDQEAADSKAVSRRAFLQNLKTVLKSSPTTIWQDRQPTGFEKKRIPEKVSFLQKVLSKLDEPARQDLQSTWLPRLTITHQCTPCNRCASICPTGALKRTGNGGNKCLLFSASRCSCCRLCEKFCNKSAIHLTLPQWAESSAGVTPAGE